MFQLLVLYIKDTFILKYGHYFARHVDDTMQKNTLLYYRKLLILLSLYLLLYKSELLSVYIVQVSAILRLLQNIIG